MIAIGRQLIADGWTVAVLTSAHFRERVERAGLEHIALPSECDFDERDLNGQFAGRARMPGFLRSRYDLEHLFIRTISAQHDRLAALLAERDIDVVLAENLFLGVLPLLSAAQANRPYVAAVCMTPLMANSADTAPFGPGFAPSTTRAGMVRNRLLTLGATSVVLRRAQRNTNAAVRDAVGCNAASFVLDWPLLADDVFVLTTPSLEYPRRDLDSKLRYVGPALGRADPGQAPPVWWDRVHGRRPVVVVTQGTLDNEDMSRLVEPTITGLAGSEALVVATTGGPPVESVRVDAANAVVTEFVPFDMMFPHTDVLVTNGGWGGVHFALTHGVPMVVVGSTEDKGEVAARVARSGAGIRLRRNSPGAIRRAVRTVLDDPSYRHRATVLQSEMSGLDGARAISDALSKPTIDAHDSPDSLPPR